MSFDYYDNFYLITKKMKNRMIYIYKVIYLTKKGDIYETQERTIRHS